MDSSSRFERTTEVSDETWALSPSPPSNTLRSKVLHSCLEPQQLTTSLPLALQLKNSELRASVLSASVLEGSLTSSPPCVPPGSPPCSNSPSSTGLHSTADALDTSMTAPTLIDPLWTRPSTDSILSSQTVVGLGTESANAFFTAMLGSSEKKGIERLASIAQRLPKAEELPDGLYGDFWSKRSRIFQPESGQMESETEVAYRLRRLKQAHQNIGTKDPEARRFWLVFLAHEVEYISRSEDINHFTSQGVNSSSAAKKMVQKELGIKDRDFKRCGNISKVMKEGGGPAALLINGDIPSSTWERGMTHNEITRLFAYISEKLPHLHKWIRSHNPDVSRAISDGFVKYGWSIPGLLNSNTSVIKILNPYLQNKGPHPGPANSESENTGSRVDQPGASALLQNHDLPTTPFGRFSPDSNSFNQGTSTRTYDTVESMSGSKSSRSWRKDLTDLVVTGNLSYTVNGPDELMDLTVAEFLNKANDQSMDLLFYPDYVTNQPVESTDPAITGFLRGATIMDDLYGHL